MIFNISRALGRYALKKMKEAEERNQPAASMEWLRLALQEYDRECGLEDQTTKEEVANEALAGPTDR